MTDILGPGANAANVVSVRPADTRSASTPDLWFKDCTSPAGNDGTQVLAGWLNAILAQLRVAIRAAGVAEDNLDTMLWRAMQAAAGGGLSSVARDATLTGAGTTASPLGVAKVPTSNIAIRVDSDGKVNFSPYARGTTYNATPAGTDIFAYQVGVADGAVKYLTFNDLKSLVASGNTGPLNGTGIGSYAFVTASGGATEAPAGYPGTWISRGADFVAANQFDGPQIHCNVWQRIA